MIEQQKQLLAILFAGGEAVEISRIARALELEPGAVLRHAGQLRERLEEQGFPFELLQVGDRLQLATRSEYAQVVRDALELRRNAPLSQAAFEVLAIIAYNQPVTRAFIEQVRGVDSAGVVNSLLEKQLVEEAGRMELPGRPLAYQTTANFLRCFGLESIEALPELPDT